MTRELWKLTTDASGILGMTDSFSRFAGQFEISSTINYFTYLEHLRFALHEPAKSTPQTVSYTTNNFANAGVYTGDIWTTYHDVFLLAVQYREAVLAI